MKGEKTIGIIVISFCVALSMYLLFGCNEQIEDDWHKSDGYYRIQAYCTICNKVVWTDGCNCYECEEGDCLRTVVGCIRPEGYVWDGDLTDTHWISIEEYTKKGGKGNER